MDLAVNVGEGKYDKSGGLRELWIEVKPKRENKGQLEHYYIHREK